jgi:hypothetical protein
MNNKQEPKPPPAQVIKPMSIPSAEAFGTPTALKSYPYWQYFLALEVDLYATTRYVEPARRNFETYSIEFARILLSAGAEVDVVAQVFCRRVDASSTASNIQHYREQILSAFPRFPTMRVVVPRFALLLEPWRDWEKVRHRHGGEAATR